MSGPEVVQEVNDLSEKTWDSKYLNLLRLLDDNGYKDQYFATHVGDRMTVLFPVLGLRPSKEFVVDLSADATHRNLLVAIDDFFGAFKRDRSYEAVEDEGVPDEE